MDVSNLSSYCKEHATGFSVATGMLVVTGVALAVLAHFGLLQAGWNHTSHFFTHQVSPWIKSNASIVIPVGSVCVGGGALLTSLAIFLYFKGVKKAQQSERNERNADEISQPQASSAPAKVKSKKPKTMIQGNIIVRNYRSAGVLGENLKELFHDTAKVERSDGKEWKNVPNELLIECEISGNLKGPLKNKAFLYLPLCLFTNNEDYTSYKEYGDVVTFDYENCHYELTLQRGLYHPTGPFKTIIGWANDEHYKRGALALPPTEIKEGKGFQAYPSIIDVKQHERALKEAAERKSRFMEKFPSAVIDGDYPMPPNESKIEESYFKLYCPAIEKIEYFNENGSFGFYAKKDEKLFSEAFCFHPKSKDIRVKTKEYPELFPHEYLFMYDNIEVNVEDIKYENGFLIIPYKKIIES